MDWLISTRSVTWTTCVALVTGATSAAPWMEKPSNGPMEGPLTFEWKDKLDEDNKGEEEDTEGNECMNCTLLGVWRA